MSVSSAPAGNAMLPAAASGDRYIAAMAARRSDRLTRKAFVDLAASLLPPGGRILDFGGGPGIDARAYAARGYRVCVYDLVVANFAPLNLVHEPDEVFRAFAALTPRRGRVLASVLNPDFAGDLRYRWWWTHRPALRRRGETTFDCRCRTSPLESASSKPCTWRRSARTRSW